MNKYMSRVEAILDGTFTGEPQSRVEALLINLVAGGGGGGGGATNYNFLTGLPSINGVQLKGNKTSQDLGITAEGTLAAELKASKTVGGVTSGKTYAIGTSLEDIFRDLLNPTERPTFTGPSAKITSSISTLQEVGTTPTAVLTVSFDRGKIQPAYGTSGYRSGNATGYILNGGAEQSGNTFSVTVSETNKNFTATVKHADGEQPKDSAGNDYSSPLAAGQVTSDTLKFEFVNPIYSNATNITQIAKEQLVSKSSGIKSFNFPAQTQEHPQMFDVPASWNVTAVESFNTLSQSWQNAASGFDVTDTTHDGVAYKRYTDNRNAAAGARQVRFKWTP